MFTIECEVEYEIVDSKGRRREPLHKVLSELVSELPEKYIVEPDILDKIEIVSNVHTSPDSLLTEIDTIIGYIKDVCDRYGYIIDDTALFPDRMTQLNDMISGLHVHIGTNEEDIITKMLSMKKIYYKSERTSYVDERLDTDDSKLYYRVKDHEFDTPELRKRMKGLGLTKTDKIIPWIVYRPEYGTIEYRKFDTSLNINKIREYITLVVKTIL